MNTEHHTLGATTPEQLAAILAEMRGIARPLRVGGDLCSNVALPATISTWADRIEAAVKRLVREERTEAIDEALAHAEEVRAEKCRNCTRAPGNAAAMRAVLNSIADIAEDAFGGPWRHREASQGHALSLIIDAVKNALSAPARNCDRFATVGAAHKAWRATDQERDFADWLFATAQGGAK